MAMKMKNRCFYAAMMAICVALAGCEREWNHDGFGEPVRFSAMTRSSNITKTVYSGDKYTSENLERIDWENGDLIRIISNEVSAPSGKYADYTITLKENSDQYSYASAAPSGSDHGLIWGDGVHTFYSMYPAPSATGAQSGLDLSIDGSGNGVVTASLPVDQSFTTTRSSRNEDYYGDMLLDYMTACAQAASGNDVTLSFTPIVTTFYVTVINTTGSTMTLKKVALSSEASALSATYKTTITSSGSRSYLFEEGGSWVSTPTRTASNSTIYAAFSSGISMAAGTSVTVALFAIPKDITQLTLSVTADETGTVSLPIKYSGSWLSFTGGNKHNLNNVEVPPVSYAITVDKTYLSYDETGVVTSDLAYTVTSTKTIGGVSYAAPWKAQVKVSDTGDETVDWVDMTSSNRPAWMPLFPLNSQDTPEATVGLGMKYQRNVDPQPVVSHVTRLKNGTILTADGSSVVDNSTEANAVDLSYYDFINRKMDTEMYTANCYIISSPGWYKFPCVYGNAIEKGATAEASYKGLLLRANHLDRFKKMNDFSIYTRGPWLEKHGTLIVTNYHRYADLYWHQFTDWDSTNDVAITAGKNLNTNVTVGTPFNVIKNVGLVDYNADQAYVKFYVDPNEIRPGNALIVTREALGSSTHKITWSWHIWITDQNMTPITVSNGSSSQDVLPVNLGWVDDQEGQYYVRRAEQIRFINTADGEDQAISDAITVVQPEKETSSTSGWQTYYQWGRKDPFAAGITSVESGDHLLYQSILNPDKMFYEESTEDGVHYYDWTSANYNNLWESKCNDYGQPAASVPNHKTVYDPSPRKFCISPDMTFDGFKTNGYSGSFDNGYHFYTSSAQDETIFFPASGHIPYSSGIAGVAEPTTGSYWTYHAVANTQTRMSYAFYLSANGTVTPKNDVNTMRAYGYSVRPVEYDETLIWPVDDGTTSASINFLEQWGTSSISDLRSTTVTFDTDITLSFGGNVLSHPEYGYDSSSKEGTVEIHINNVFTISTTNTHKHIVMIELSISQEGNSTISTDKNSYADGVWGDATATTDYTTTPPTWTGGQSSVTFSTAATGTRSWKISGITVYYYTD